MITLQLIALSFLFVTLGAGLAKAQLPDLPNKPQPQFDIKSFCPPMGSLSKNSDPERNKMKNRVDGTSNYFPLAFDDLKTLPSPQGRLKKRRATWTIEQKEIVKRNEGIPVVVHAYLLLSRANGVVSGAKPEGPESCNCWKTERKFVDFRIWLVNIVGDPKSEAIVAQITPRVRQARPQWTLENLTHLAQERFPIRIYGWLIFEEDEKAQIGISRATLWEIHPVIQIQFKENGVWKTL